MGWTRRWLGPCTAGVGGLDEALVRTMSAVVGGLDEALDKIMQLCAEQMVPFVFALGRRSLGRACAKLVPVSVVGIFNFEGSEVGASTPTIQRTGGRLTNALAIMFTTIQ